MSMSITSRRIATVAALVVTGAIIAWAVMPGALPVETAVVSKGRFVATVDEDGKTRVRERYSVAAPLAGRLGRIRFKVGDQVKADDIVNGLENLSYKGVLHAQTGFDKQTHDLLEGRYVMPFVQWQAGGKQAVIFPEKFKTGDYVKPAWWKP